jgi:hypothetical protein
MLQRPSGFIQLSFAREEELGLPKTKEVGSTEGQPQRRRRPVMYYDNVSELSRVVLD